MPRPETRASPSSAGTLLSTVMLLAIIVTTTWLRMGVAHDIVRPLSNVAEIPASPARSGVELLGRCAGRALHHTLPRSRLLRARRRPVRAT